MLGFVIYIYASKKDANHEFKDILKKEEELNKIIKDDVNINYIRPSISNFPLMQEFEVKTDRESIAFKKQESVEDLINLPMVSSIKGLSNEEIKIKFGSNNFDKITAYEQNYYTFLHALNDWALLLKKADHFQEAIIILEEALILKSDIIKTYILLSDLYKETGQQEALEGLKEYLTTNNVIDNNKIKEYINNL
jgi:tetratricopeptide (TPR) repeat protein